MNVLFVPSRNKNPYLSLLSDGLSSVGVNVFHHKDLPNNNWLYKNRRTIDIIHMHWLQPLYRRGIGTPIGFIYFIEKLYFAKLIGYKLIWTTHNITPHQSKFYWLDLLGRKYIFRMVDHVIAHCDAAISELNNISSKNLNISVIPHGSFGSIYPNTISKQEARKKLGISDNSFVYIFFGKIKYYKGLDLLIKAFKELNLDNTELIICGQCDSDKLRVDLMYLSRGRNNIRFYLEYIPDVDVQYYFAASDVVVIPFRKVLTSGTVMLALSFSRPVISPKLGCLPELISPDIGIIYEPSDKMDLLRSMDMIRNLDLVEMGKQAFKKSKSYKFTWENVAYKTHQVYIKSNN